MLLTGHLYVLESEEVQADVYQRVRQYYPDGADEEAMVVSSTIWRRGAGWGFRRRGLSPGIRHQLQSGWAERVKDYGVLRNEGPYSTARWRLVLT